MGEVAELVSPVRSSSRSRIPSSDVVAAGCVAAGLAWGSRAGSARPAHVAASCSGGDSMRLGISRFNGRGPCYRAAAICVASLLAGGIRMM